MGNQVMTQLMKQRFTLESAYNVRDLSGYLTSTGQVTSAFFIRADCFTPLSGSDTNALFSQGIRTVIDLRSAEECTKIPSGLGTHEDIIYIHHPFFSGSSQLNFGTLPDDFTMGLLYVYMLDYAQSAIRDFFTHAARTRGRILFHCSAGKDRTGVLSALLLKLADVSDVTIIQDYALTEIFLAEKLALLKENSGLPAMLSHIEDEMLGANPGNMEHMLRHLLDAYGGIRNYLNTIGVSKDDIYTVYCRMIKESNQL